jgi:hypothetical protein
VARTQGAFSIARKAIREELDAVRQSLPQLLRVYTEAVDPSFQWLERGSVFQYTRFEVLRSMLFGGDAGAASGAKPLKDLWATSSLYMNDAEEFNRGKRVIGEALGSPQTDAITRQISFALKDADPLQVYCTCFSAIGDDLSQWRGYGDNGAGVCLEFDLEALLTDLNGVGYWLLYGKSGDDSTQREVARHLLDYVHETLRNSVPASMQQGVVFREIREQLSELWPAVFLAFKHRDFEAEREFRIVYSEAVGQPTPTCFRPTPLVPFVKLKMISGVRLPLRSIRLGPAVSDESTYRGLCLALRELGLVDVAVHKSSIPYVPK